MQDLKAAREFNVLLTTLQDQNQWKSCAWSKTGPKPCLNKVGESELTEFLEVMGFGMTRKQVMDI